MQRHRLAIYDFVLDHSSTHAYFALPCAALRCWQIALAKNNLADDLPP